MSKADFRPRPVFPESDPLLHGTLVQYAGHYQRHLKSEPKKKGRTETRVYSANGTLAAVIAAS